MDRTRWKSLKDAFATAVADAAAGHAINVIEACGGDRDLAAEVQRLVDEHLRLTRAGAPPPPVLIERDTLVAGRFRIADCIGSGRFGDVYRVVDAATGAELALKILRAADPVAIQYFKSEVRLLTDVNHPNIVGSYELIADDGRWMYSMELIDGIDLRRYLSALPIDRRLIGVRSCVRQIAEGVAALHGHGVLHRDLKPSNVLVTRDGRVVLVDFGLARVFRDDPRRPMTFAGTPDYMSPEQAAGEPLSEPSDWYAVGVIVYEALTGRRPFEGGWLDVLRRKQVERPQPPSVVVADVPPEFDVLCAGLLAPDPRQRASYADVMRALAPAATVVHRAAPVRPFIGRERLLQQLRDAYDRAETQRVVVHLSGPSGIGKTAVVREFLRRLTDTASPLIFAGRCYNGESVPFQALDDLVDQIVQHLRALSPAEVLRWLPRDFSALATMFPAFAPFLSRRQDPAARPDLVELRARALGALREMLGRFADGHRLVLAIDDLQWGDADGCAALGDLLSSPDAPSMLVLLAYRSEDVEANASLSALRDHIDTARSVATVLDVERLTDDETETLAASLLAHPIDRALLTRVLADAVGSPFLVGEIVQRVNQRGVDRVLARPFSLNEVVNSRIEALSIACRYCMELVAVAGQPTELAVVQACVRLPNVLAARDELIAHRLLRSRMVRGVEELEVYHDRIRAAIVARLASTSLVRRHRELAEALEAQGARDPERIAVHFEQAGMPESCAQFALAAGRRAARMLAFNKAARFLELALSTGAIDAAEIPGVHTEIADALANAGRGQQAAEHYLAACAGAPREEALELKQRAAEQLLYSGHVDRGLAMFEDVLSHVGMSLPKPMSRMPVGLLLRRARLKIRGLTFRERDASLVSRDMLLKVDASASVATGLSLVDVARGAALQTTSLLLALEAGEPGRIARALAMEAGYHSIRGARSKARVDALLARALELSDRTGDARAIGLTAVMTACAAWSLGRWMQCFELARAAREVLRSLHERVIWERDTASIFEIDGLRWAGRWADMTAILPQLLEDARARGDLYVQALLQMHAGSCAQLAADDPARAREGLAILERWSNDGFHVEHLVETHNQVEIAIYEDAGADAFARIEQRWPALMRSLLMRVQNFSIQMESLRARAALCAATTTASPSRRDALLRAARHGSRAIRKQDAAWGHVLAGLIDGGIESWSGRPESAIAAFASAETEADAAGMILHAAAARRARGALLGGDAGRQLQREGECAMAAEAIVNPPRLAGLFAPARFQK